MKLKALAAACILGLSGGAHAAIDHDFGAGQFGGFGNGEFLVSVVERDDLGNGIKSYTRDLGITASAFLADTASFEGAVFTADTLLADFISSATGTISWTMGGVLNTGGNGDFTASNVGIFTTSETEITVANGPIGTSGIANGQQRLREYANAINFELGTTDVAENLSYVETNTGANSFYDSTIWGPTWAGTGFGDSEALLGDSQGFFLVRGNDADFGATSTVDAFSNWSLAADGTLTYGAVSAVPVPAAVWLFGSGLMGLVGVARRRAV